MTQATRASTPGPELREVLALLERYVSPLNVKAMVDRALRERNIAPERFTRADIRKINPNLQRALGLFLTGIERAQAQRELSELCERSSPPSGPYRTVLASEADISSARNEARRICEEAGAKTFVVQKVSTIVSELARNIVSYAGEGSLELALLENGTRRISVRAVDSGPGIPNLEEILAGHYRSRTGLGRGLIGTRRLSDRFDIQTGPSGTSVSLEVHL